MLLSSEWSQEVFWWCVFSANNFGKALGILLKGFVFYILAQMKFEDEIQLSGEEL